MVETNQPNCDSDLDLRATLDAHNIRLHISLPTATTAESLTNH